ncbi:hypothetical protein [Loigolactobacillus jiayinensis]|uniref:Uncharacterized protein n=1 Tax=Loigolactobacillus jiayinensis TaxID=2486016 RepID=A0ABW1RB31_9LACO|nr:hypothetical protein [Loigolactobacillus jiayinensis]
MNDKNIKDSIYREVYKLRVKRFVLNQDSDFFKVANPKVFLKDYVLDFDNKNKARIVNPSATLTRINL